MIAEVTTLAVDVIMDRRGEHRVELFNRAGRLDQQIVRVDFIDHDALRFHVVRYQLDLQIRRREQSPELIYVQEAMIESTARIDGGGDVIIELVLMLHLENDRYGLRRARCGRAHVLRLKFRRSSGLYAQRKNGCGGKGHPAARVNLH